MPDRRPYVSGNWKMNMTPSEARSYIEELVPQVEGVDGVEVGQVHRDGGAAHRRGHLLRRLRVPVHHDDGSSGLRQPDRARAADARGAAGDERPSSREVCRSRHVRDGRPFRRPGPRSPATHLGARRW